MKAVAPKATSTSGKPATPTADAKTRILLVDDHPMLRMAMRMVIEREPKFEICAEAESADDAVDFVRRLAPDLAVIDISLKSANGIELTKLLLAEVPALRILVVSMHDEDVYAERALRAGAMGYLMKLEAGEKLIGVIERIMRGEIHVSDRLREKLLRPYISRSPEKVVTFVETLSHRELEVLELIGNGHGARGIAGKLGLSAKALDLCREHLMLKLKLRNNDELERYAVQWTKRDKTS